MIYTKELEASFLTSSKGECFVRYDEHMNEKFRLEFTSF